MGERAAGPLPRCGVCLHTSCTRRLRHILAPIEFEERLYLCLRKFCDR